MAYWKSVPGATELALSSLLGSVILLLHGPIFAAETFTATDKNLPEIVVTGTTPLPGLGLPLRDVAASVQSVSGKDITRQHAGNITEFFEQNLSSVTINSAQGNPYQPDVNYRGFTASPLLGTPQGLSVFQDGVRINEPFGDVVNWDLLPQSAIANLQVMPGSNPVFGLNTLGGALAITTKNGRTNPGGQVEVSGGAFGRKTVEVEQGGTVGNIDYFLTANDSKDKGWADHNPSSVKQFFGKIGYQDAATTASLSLTAADNDLQGMQTIPRAFLDNRRQAYTFPDKNINRAQLWNLSASHFYNDNLQLSTNAYYRNYRNDNSSSNVNQNYDAITNPVSANNTRSMVKQGSYGFGTQLSYIGKLGTMDNHIVGGISGDFANSRFKQLRQDANFTASRDTLGLNDFTLGTDAKTHNSNLSIFVSDTLALNDQWSVTGSGRYNYARVNISDQTGNQPLLNSKNTFTRFNPGVGVTYNPNAALTAYATYNEGMRTPTAIELACADPNAPCTLPNNFIADPALKPVIARTGEFGLRGKLGAASGWSGSIFRTALDNDIQFISSSGASASTGYFQNVGKTRRQGLELAGHTVVGPVGVTISYSYIDATYQTAFVEHSGSNSSANAIGDIAVNRGNKLPGIPQNTLKLRLDYAPTSAWNVGTNFVYRSSIYARGDENNQDANGKISGYTMVNLDATYLVTKRLQIFARVDNLFNRQYANFGVLGQNYFNGPGRSLDGNSVSNEQFIGPGAPRGGWVGLRYSWS
ncbi:TonB-dependent receptor [Glaciimonas immobilis]|uniref:Outer membrane receptor protein involved in Fe transport n=1 Tax=Glaciimonas immobilis TaxID=728004 RepID=A0A840RVB0_9BURK|nr:TonB-dependent receptor [Glaciimonas immobilis]KAF3998672.1 TonB-dependent receptor [Glaciimonas immobilis]MBB5201543.1 outer membrane receptor protein involved in Fe transport [Glaciimonas immobilis]